MKCLSIVSVLTLILLADCGPPTGEDPAPRWPALAHSHGCVEHDGLPDTRCTPGAIRAGATLATICSYGYSRRVRPQESYTEALKLKQIRAYDLRGSASHYEEDHLVPLSIGGAPRNPANLWPEPRNGFNNAKQKDQLETWSARMACSGRIPLGHLQREIATNWAGLYRTAGGEQALRSYPPGG